MSGTTPTPTAGRRGSTNPPTPASASQNRSPSRSSAATTTTPSRTNTLKSKTGAPPSAKAAARRTGAKETDGTADEEAKAETATLIEDLKEQLRKAESASEDYQKQLGAAQSRLDEALSEQTKLEESNNQHAETILGLESQVREIARQKTDIESKGEADEKLWIAEREAASNREGELQDVIQRLKENISQREPRRSVDEEGRQSRPPSARGRTSPNPEASGLSPPPLGRRDSSQSGSQLILQKDRIIESLRLELAEAQIKVMEVDRAGGGKMQELEKSLLEARMQNAKLLEDNESYQFLLQERTLNGDFSNRFRATTPSEQSGVSNELGKSTLADELETASIATDLEDARERRTLEKAEKEIASLEDQNKAMKLYIDKIIGKLLASDHYEAVLGGPSVVAKQQQDSVAEDEANKENAGQSLLQRAGSIFGGGRSRVRPRTSLAGQGDGAFQEEGSATAAPQTANENPTTAPSVPLSVRNSMVPGRSHRRSTSEWSTGAPSYTTRTPSSSNRPVTPNSGTPRQSSLSTSSPPANSTEDGRNPSVSETATSASASDVEGGYSESVDSLSVPPVSPPRSLGGSSADGNRSGGAATVSGKQMRPLRLVQEKAEAEAEKKRQNRGSWVPVGWFNKAAQAVQQPLQQQQAPAPPAAPPASQGDARPNSRGGT